MTRTMRGRGRTDASSGLTTEVRHGRTPLRSWDGQSDFYVRYSLDSYAVAATFDRTTTQRSTDSSIHVLQVHQANAPPEPITHQQ